MKITDLFERRTMAYPDTPLDKKYRTSFKWRRAGGNIVSGYGATQDEADTACVEKIRQKFRGTYTPLWLSFRGETLLVWRDKDEWVYGHIRESEEPTSWVMGNWTSRDEAEQSARQWLAMATWDELEETSEIIITPDEQERFKSWTRTQKLWTAKYRRLLEVGWTKEEAAHLLSGVNASPGRMQELGDPWQVMREVERTWREGANHDH